MLRQLAGLRALTKQDAGRVSLHLGCRLLIIIIIRLFFAALLFHSSSCFGSRLDCSLWLGSLHGSNGDFDFGCKGVRARNGMMSAP